MLFLTFILFLGTSPLQAALFKQHTVPVSVTPSPARETSVQLPMISRPRPVVGVLSGVLLFNKDDWKIWLGGKAFDTSPISLAALKKKGIQVLSVTASGVLFLLGKDSQPQDRIFLKVGEKLPN